MPRRLAPLVFAAALLAACGGSAVAPKTWAKSVCTALTPWRATLTSLTDDAQQHLAAAKTPEQAKQDLLGLLSGAETASETARQKVVSAGTPDVDGGDRIAARFAASLKAVRDAYGHARTTVSGLSTADAGAFYKEVGTAFGQLQQEYAASALDTSKVSSAPLRKAFNEVPECH